jgi:hypothetical protein
MTTDRSNSRIYTCPHCNDLVERPVFFMPKLDTRGHCYTDGLDKGVAVELVYLGKL